MRLEKTPRKSFAEEVVRVVPDRDHIDLIVLRLSDQHEVALEYAPKDGSWTVSVQGGPAIEIFADGSTTMRAA